MYERYSQSELFQSVPASELYRTFKKKFWKRFLNWWWNVCTSLGSVLAVGCWYLQTFLTVKDYGSGIIWGGTVSEYWMDSNLWDNMKERKCSEWDLQWWYIESSSIEIAVSYLKFLEENGAKFIFQQLAYQKIVSRLPVSLDIELRKRGVNHESTCKAAEKGVEW